MPFELLHSTPPGKYSLDFLRDAQSLRLRNLIAGFMDPSLGEKASSLLAIPMEREGDGTIDWYSPVEGQAIPLEALDPAAWAKARVSLASTAYRLVELAITILSSQAGDRSRDAAGQVLAKLARDVAGFLAGAPVPIGFFMVGTDLVAFNWGLSEPEKRGQNPPGGSPPGSYDRDVAQILETGVLPPGLAKTPPPPPPAQNPALAPALATAPTPDQAGAGAPAWDPSQPPSQDAAPVAAKHRSELPWDIVRVVFALALTLLAVGACAVFFLPALGYLVSYSAPVVDHSKELALREELHSLRMDLLETVALCRVGTEEAPVASLEPLPKPVPEDPAPAPDGAGAHGDPVSVPPPGPVVGEGIRIPMEGDPNDLSFMEGCWKQDAGMFNGITGLPTHSVYCLDKNGEGIVVIHLYDKSQKHIDTCQGKAWAKRGSKGVVIESEGPACQKGPPFIPDTLACARGSDGATLCRGTNDVVKKRKDRNFFETRFTFMDRETALTP
jgi:hypothetical protein